MPLPSVFQEGVVGRVREQRSVQRRLPFVQVFRWLPAVFALDLPGCLLVEWGCHQRVWVRVESPDDPVHHVVDGVAGMHPLQKD